MRVSLRIGAAVLAGFLFGVVLVIACGTGPGNAGAQTTGGGSVTCNVPPVTCTVPPITCDTAGAARSAVAGTWGVAMTIPPAGTGPTCNGALHLSGTNAALTGAWACLGNQGFSTSGIVTGEFAAGHLALNFGTHATLGGVLVMDATVASAGKSATGTGTGFGPGGAGGTFSLMLTAQ